MKKNTIDWIRDVAFTTLLSFFLISFLYLGVFSLFTEGEANWHLFQSFRYIFGKLFFCVFPFSLCLGFANRMFAWKKNRAVLRMIHFFVTFLAYFIFMDLLFNVIHEPDADPAIGEVIKETLPFFLFYPVTLWVTRLGRLLFVGKKSEDFKSILD